LICSELQIPQDLAFKLAEIGLAGDESAGELALLVEKQKEKEKEKGRLGLAARRNSQ
jgi:hypothetical protein